ncbi:MAG: tryptophan--tRNA ligase [Planctomycetes bacterium]|nr:tryptophan--tRNA ligase [Planctomycetota bacterium]
METYLSGIQPSGLLHIGNYFGAIRQHIQLQQEDGEHFYFIADYHALTSNREPEKLREFVFETAVTYLALGFEPEKACLFRQSDVPEVTEIAWLLASVTGMGLLERAHSFKDKVAQGVKPNVGLFTYPILMAADILAYDSTCVPVGKDQIQHVEMTQDMAGYFNQAYGEVFVRPEIRTPKAEKMQKVPGLDGQKMSKSYGNTIWIFEEGKALKKVINRVVTDSRPPEEPKDPEELFLFDLMALFCDEAEVNDWKDKVRAGGEGAPGYGHLKGVIRHGMEEYFASARERRKELMADRGEVERVLAAGAEKARARATEVRDRAAKASGLS